MRARVTLIIGGGVTLLLALVLSRQYPQFQEYSQRLPKRVVPQHPWIATDEDLRAHLVPQLRAMSPRELRSHFVASLSSPPVGVSTPSVIAGLLKKTLFTYGGEVEFHDGFDWEREYFGDYESTLLLNRHPFLAEVAKNPEPAVMRAAQNVLNDWLSASMESQYLSGRAIWTVGRQFLWMPRSYWLSAATRLSGSWHPYLLAAVRSEAITDHEWLAILRSVWNQASLVEQAMTPGDDRFAIASSALVITALLFPEFTESERWLRVGVERLGQSARELFSEEGSYRPISPHYGAVTLRALLRPLEELKRFRHPIDPTILERLRAVQRYMKSLTLPNGELPALRVSDRTDVRELSQRLSAIVGGEYDFRPIELFPTTGHVVLRAGQSYALLDGARMGTLPHDDALTVLFYGAGAHLLDDGGRHSYVGASIDQYFQSSGAHSVVFVDGDGQARRDCPEWHADLQVGDRMVSGLYPGPWRSSADVRHQRTLGLLDENRILIIDQLEASDGKEHSFESNFQFGPGTASVVGNSLEFVSTESTARFRLMQWRQSGTVRAEIFPSSRQSGRGFIAPSYQLLREAPVGYFQGPRRGRELVISVGIVGNAETPTVQFCESTDWCVDIDGERISLPPLQISMHCKN